MRPGVRVELRRFKLRFKRLGPPEEEIIEASSLERAVELGEVWCGQHRVKFIGVRKEVLFSEGDDFKEETR